jgi:hypothetical protein
MNSICDELIRTYNTNILDNLEPSIQAQFYLAARDNLNTGKGKKTLMQLIVNHYKATKPRPFYIQGPHTLTCHWNDDTKQMVYIFGEKHLKDINCSLLYNYNDKTKIIKSLQKGCPKGKIRNPLTRKCIDSTSRRGQTVLKEAEAKGTMPIDKFIVELMKSTDVFLDIYVELPAYTGEKYIGVTQTEHSTIGSIFKRVKKCIEYKNRDDNLCRLSRVHYIDVRNDVNLYIQKLGPSIHLEVVLFYIKQLKLSKEGSIIEYGDIFMQNWVRKILSSWASDEYAYYSFWENQIKANALIEKEIDRSLFKNEIYQYVKDKVFSYAQKYRSEFYEFALPILNFAQNRDTLLKTPKILNYLLDINAVIMDGYTLGRIFKKFNISKKASKKEFIDQPESPHNIVIYAGDFHSRDYREFLRLVGFVEIETTGSIIDRQARCLDMRQFSQPFFSCKGLYS